MKIEAVEIKVGNILHYENALWRVTKTMHVKPGKGGAYMQVEMKDVVNGTKQNIRFRSSETVERAILEQQDYQFLYRDGDNLEVMDTSTYEQTSLSVDLLGVEQAALLLDGMQLKIETFEDKPLFITMPESAIYQVQECEAVVKGQTASSSYKPAIINGGVRVMVPPFISIGDKIVVKTQDIEYFERAK